MAHIADVGFIHAHAKRDCRHHGDRALAHESVLVGPARVRVQAGVIGNGVESCSAQEFSHLSGEPARQTIDDARIGALVFKKAQSLSFPIALGPDREPEIRPVEPVQDGTALFAE